MPSPVVFRPEEQRIFSARPRLDTYAWSQKTMRMVDGPLRGHLWDAGTTPHAKGIMAAFDDPGVRKIYFLAPSQSGKTTIAFLCFFSALAARPDNWGIGMPDRDAVEAVFQGKLHRFFAENPALKRRLADVHEALQSREIVLADGSRISGMYAGSEGSMRSKPMPYVLVDEPDAFLDPSAMNTMQERADAYHSMELSKIMITCRPKGTEDGSVIWTDARRQAQAWMIYHAVCPACGAAQVMEHPGLTAADGTKDAKRIRQERLGRYRCAHCGCLWNDSMRNSAVRAGYWQDSLRNDARPEDRADASVVAFHFRSWESPLVSLSDVLADWFEAQGNPRLLQLFDNNRCAKPYKFVQLQTDWESLRKSCLDYMPQGVVPDWACAITCAVDMQMDHFFWSMAAHGLSPARIHIIDYGRVATWNELRSVIFGSQYQKAGGEMMGPWRAALDTGGGRDKPYEDSRTMQAYQFIMQQRPGVVFGTKGMSRRQPGQLVDVRTKEQMSDGRKLRSGFSLHFIDTDAFKRQIFWSLSDGRDEEPITFHGGTDDGYLRQIASEKLERGRDGTERWVKIRDNHYLDCLVLHCAMAFWQWKPALAQLAVSRPAPSAGGQERTQDMASPTPVFNGQGLFAGRI